MEIDEKIVYWVELSDYDLGTAEIMQCRDILSKTKELQQWIKQKL